MRRRPLLLLFSALLFFYFPIELGIRLYSGHPCSWVELVFFGLLPLVLIAGLVKVSKVGWYTLVALIALWGVQDLNLYYSTRGKTWSFLSHLGIYLFSLSYFINPRIRHLYFDPKLRWWRTKPRFETHLPAVMKWGAQWDYPILRNISEGGCFLELDQFLAISDMVSLNIPLPIPLTTSVIKVEGEVRWVSKDEKNPGMGIQFKGVSSKDLEAIKEFIRRGL